MSFSLYIKPYERENDLPAGRLDDLAIYRLDDLARQFLKFELEWDAGIISTLKFTLLNRQIVQSPNEKSFDASRSFFAAPLNAQSCIQGTTYQSFKLPEIPVINV